MGGPERGYDGAKRLSGRKRHLLVDTGGLVLGVHVHAASLHDRDGAQRLLIDELKRGLPRMELLWADGAYTRGFREWAEGERRWRVEVPHHRDRQLWRYGLEEKPRGFLVLPRRWVVERTFAHKAFTSQINARYGREPGVMFYTHVSDQYAPFYSRVINTSVRDATHVLDGLLYHETDLDIEEHYVDTEGYTDQVFAMCHLLGFRFAPRIRDLKDRRIFTLVLCQCSTGG